VIRGPSGLTPSGGAHRPRPITNTDLAELLCSVSAPLFEARRLHLNAYGCLIPHVFMGDVLKRIGECLGARKPNARGTKATEADGILAAIERGMVEGDRETRNAIAISFTRDSELEVFFSELRAMMGPRTRAQLRGK